MTDQSTSAKLFEELFERALDPHLLKLGQEIRAVADYDIPEEHRGPFLRFHNFITEPQPSYVSAWRADEQLERKWYNRHVSGILHDVRGGLAAAHYHRERLARLEDAVTDVLAGSEFPSRMGNSVMALGGTRKMDFEFQAFVLACRRTLDYLAGALASYFKAECNSFRKLPKGIARQHPASVVEAIGSAHTRHAGDLNFILAEGRGSTRNRIAHYEYVAAGVINLSRRGFVLVGGGEELGLTRQAGDARLQDVLSARLRRLHACAADMIDSFVAAAREVDQRG